MSTVMAFILVTMLCIVAKYLLDGLLRISGLFTCNVHNFLHAVRHGAGSSSRWRGLGSACSATSESLVLAYPLTLRT